MQQQSAAVALKSLALATLYISIGYKNLNNNACHVIKNQYDARVQTSKHLDKK